MKCPYCQHRGTSVLDSRPASDNGSIRRRRECASCSKRFTTKEHVEVIDLSIIKKDGRSEPFDRTKLLRGILKACEKRPVRRERIERAINDIELQLRQMDRTEIPSRLVGDLVVEKLKALDEVAYVRFASVYKRFTEARQFVEAAREAAKFNKSASQKGAGGRARRITASAPL